MPDDAGPVLVTVEYRIDGAYSWGVFEDVAQPGRFIETFHVESWLEHLRQHARVTQADRKQEEIVRGLVLEEPKVSHLIAAERGHDPPKEPE